MSYITEKYKVPQEEHGPAHCIHLSGGNVELSEEGKKYLAKHNVQVCDGLNLNRDDAEVLQCATDNGTEFNLHIMGPQGDIGASFSRHEARNYQRKLEGLLGVSCTREGGW